MFIRGYFNSIMEILDAQFKGMARKGQNPTDRGELSEVFVENFLTDIFSDQFKIFRGGKIIDIDEAESKQIDIVLLAKNTPKLFGNKGVYPIESVFGAFSVTSDLSHTKLFGNGKSGIIDEFQSIPKNEPRFEFNKPSLALPSWETSVMDMWNKRFPFKCAFGFTGDINRNWETELNTMVVDNNDFKNSLPDLIVVNKKGVIRKSLNKPTQLIGGGTTDKDFFYTSFEHADCAIAIATIVNELYVLSTWQDIIAPKYHEYFNKDFRVP